jgi:hypothetical protein
MISKYYTVKGYLTMSMTMMTTMMMMIMMMMTMFLSLNTNDRLFNETVQQMEQTYAYILTYNSSEYSKLAMGRLAYNIKERFITALSAATRRKLETKELKRRKETAKKAEKKSSSLKETGPFSKDSAKPGEEKATSGVATSEVTPEASMRHPYGPNLQSKINVRKDNMMHTSDVGIPFKFVVYSAHDVTVMPFLAAILGSEWDKVGTLRQTTLMHECMSAWHIFGIHYNRYSN